MAKLTKKSIVSLLAICAAATATPPVFAYLTAEAAKPLADAGLAEGNPAMLNPANAAEFAVRPTAAGMTEAAKHQPAPAAGPGVAGGQPSAPQPSQPSQPSPYAVVVGVSRPTVKRGGGGGNVYPFDTMAAPVAGPNGPQEASFFVPATTDKPNPAKSLASTVSSATKRYNDAAGNATRKFVVRSIADGAPWGDQYKGVKGAGVFRTL